MLASFAPHPFPATQCVAQQSEAEGQPRLCTILPRLPLQHLLLSQRVTFLVCIPPHIATLSRGCLRAASCIVCLRGDAARIRVLRGEERIRGSTTAVRLDGVKSLDGFELGPLGTSKRIWLPVEEKSNEELLASHTAASGSRRLRSAAMTRARVIRDSGRAAVIRVARACPEIPQAQNLEPTLRILASSPWQGSDPTSSQGSGPSPNPICCFRPGFLGQGVIAQVKRSKMSKVDSHGPSS